MKQLIVLGKKIHISHSFAFSVTAQNVGLVTSLMMSNSSKSLMIITVTRDDKQALAFAITYCPGTISWTADGGAKFKPTNAGR